TEDAFVAKLFPRIAELRVQLSGSGGLTIFWPYGLPNFELQSTDVLNGTNTVWMTPTNAPTRVGDDNAIPFSGVNGNMYFRLRRGCRRKVPSYENAATGFEGVGIQLPSR